VLGSIAAGVALATGVIFVIVHQPVSASYSLENGLQDAGSPAQKYIPRRFTMAGTGAEHELVGIYDNLNPFSSSLSAAPTGNGHVTVGDL
jgi:hypothetical protein